MNHSDYAIDSANYSQDKRIPQLRALEHSWILRKGFAVSGRVVDADGNPIAGATLGLGELNAYSHKGPFPRTDADGRYRFERVSPRYDRPRDDDPIRFTVAVVKPGFMPVMESVPGYGRRPLNESTQQERVVNFTLRQGATVTLHVTDTQDRPIPGAWVLPSTWRDTDVLSALRRFGIPSEADEEGNWQWTDAPTGASIGYDVMKQGFADVRRHIITVNEDTVEETVVLRRPQIITGTVIDTKTKQPIAEFLVQRAFEGVAGHPDGLYWASDKTKGKNGKYRKQVTMPSDSYTYRVLAEGYETTTSKSIPFTEGEKTVNFELQPVADAKPDA